MTEATLNRIRNWLDRNLSLKKISASLVISLNSVNNTITNIANNKKNAEILNIKKGRKKKQNVAIKNKITQTLLRNSTHAHKELMEVLKNEGTIRSQSTVSRLLNQMDYTRKRVVRVSERRNTSRSM
ncbi:hypothetical protein CDIK_0389 [Cucumispora dikerogammari]|nr:hypothetical protein CDIK_0389 [Cucumispora dikerogammari]